MPGSIIQKEAKIILSEPFKPFAAVVRAIFFFYFIFILFKYTMTYFFVTIIVRVSWRLNALHLEVNILCEETYIFFFSQETKPRGCEI